METGRAPVDFAETLIESRERFLAFLQRRIADSDLAEDILQDSLLKAVRAAPGLRDEQALVPWFYRILQNAVIDAYRSKGSTPAMLDIEAGFDLPATNEDVARICECFVELLPSLRPEYAELIRKLDIEEQSTAAVADALGISAGNLKVRRHRARQALRQKLEESCRVCAEHHCLDCTCKAD